MQKNSKLAALALALAPFAIDAHAALYDRGNGMIYDSVQNITWLQDMNYFKSLGYSDSGALPWYDANFYASFLEYGGYSDWRLAGPARCNDCSPGYGLTHSELGHLFYVELGNKSAVDAPSGVPYGLVNTGPFINFQRGSYWSELYNNDMPELVWTFDMRDGYNGFRLNRDYMYAAIVRDGDVSPVPVPAAAWLLGSALVGLAGAVRRRQ